MDMNNYIADLYKYLNEERATRSSIKKIVGASIALPIMIPFSAPISVALTACLASLRSTSVLITKNSTDFQN